ncbi:hypothetical protein ABZ412_08825 [Nocardia sp. NPDC005746]|uniref:hypothetical protein n=1 Tax=Nocardia sp. NPDC005746 TaxID=3157062 RepID=UPI0033E6FD99
MVVDHHLVEQLEHVIGGAGPQREHGRDQHRQQMLASHPPQPRYPPSQSQRGEDYR